MIGRSLVRLSGNPVLPWTTSAAGRCRRCHRIVGLLLLLLAVAWVLLATMARPAQASPGQQDAGSSEACRSETAQTPDLSPGRDSASVDGGSVHADAGSYARDPGEGTDSGVADRTSTPGPDAQTRPTMPTEQSLSAPDRGPGSGPDVHQGSDFTTRQADPEPAARERQTTPPADLSPADRVVGRVGDPRAHPD